MNPIRMNDRVVHGFIFFPGFFPVNEAKFNTVRLLGRPTGSKGISFTVSLDPVGLLSGIFRGRGAGQAGARPMSGPVPKISTYSTSQAAPGRESCPVLTTRIIPCLDVKDGRVVKGVNFVDLRDAGDAVENAKFYAEAGADYDRALDYGTNDYLLRFGRGRNWAARGQHEAGRPDRSTVQKNSYLP